MADEIRRAARERQCAALVGLDTDRVLAIIAVTGSDPVPPVVDDIAEAAGSLQRALEAAAEALAFGRKAAGGRAVFHFAELGAHQLLVRLAQDPELARFVDAELSPLLEHDARSRAKLMPTLRSYLDHAGHKARTVQALRVQRRTLYARLARIERILGRDLGTQDTRTRLTLAIQALDLLQDRGSGVRTVRASRPSGWA